MNGQNNEFNSENIKPVELTLLNGQVDIILRSLELYSYNLEFMLNSNDTSNDERQEKLAMTKYTYEQVLAIQAEQVYGKADNSNNNSTLVNQIRKSDNIIDIIKHKPPIKPNIAKIVRSFIFLFYAIKQILIKNRIEVVKFLC